MSLGVSFVVPVYNKAPYLPGVLNAIYAQEGEFEREFIFVDDGSIDGSTEILMQHTKTWPNSQVIIQKNGGPMAATNRGIFVARLPFLKLVDADDLLTTSSTNILLEGFKQYPQAIASFGRASSYDFLHTPLLSGKQNPSYTYISDSLRLTLRNSPFNPSQCLIKTSIAQKVGGCDPKIYYSQDYSLTLRIARQGGFVQTNALIAYLPKDVPNRVSGNNARELQQVVLACSSFLEEFPDTSLDLFRFAAHRCASRAWKYQYRQQKASMLSKWFQNHLLGYLPFLSKKYCLSLIQKSAQAFNPI